MEDKKVPLSILANVKSISKAFDVAREKVRVDPYDTEAWLAIIFEIQSKPILVARPVWEEFLYYFPTSAKHWKQFVDQEIAERNFEQAELIFKQCLKQCLNVELWRTYIAYIILKFTMTGATNKTEVIKAFEYSVNAVGLDISSTPLWVDYLRFLKSQATTTPMEESLKMDQLRKLFQRVVVIPLQNLEHIWKDYDAYENTLNKVLAKALLSELGPKYMNARSIYRERKNFTDGLQKQMLARPPRLIMTSKDANQVKIWKNLIAFEKTNPHKLDDEAFRDRVSFTFNQCLMCLFHFPEIWHEAAMFHVTSPYNFPEDAIKVYKRGTRAIKESNLLALTYVDYLETLGKNEKAKKEYEKLILRHDSLIYIQYIRFTRRCIDIREARKLFYRVIKMPNCTFQVYVANAEIELYTNNSPKVAQHIYDMGFKLFNNSTSFLLLYVDFLFRLNDNVNIRTLFEKILNQITLDKAQEVWNTYHKYEKLCGTLENIESLEKRKIVAYNSNPLSMESLVQRYRYLDLWPCSAHDLVNVDSVNSNKKQQILSQMTGGLFLSNKGDVDRATSVQKIINKEKLAKPDLSKLVVFNPESMNQNFLLGNGDTINLPASFAAFINAITRPVGNRWDGVRIDVPGLMNVIADCTLIDPKVSENVIGKKRKFDDKEGSSKSITDVYRDRQASKIQKQNSEGFNQSRNKG
jgi:cleavage stimulation factor subunit 3